MDKTLLVIVSCILLLYIVAAFNMMTELSRTEIIIRDDDVKNISPALKWLSDLAMQKDIKITFAVIPKYLAGDPELISYLKGLDPDHFEMATHGFDHEDFSGMSYLSQYDLIDKGTEAMVQAFHIRPYTFIPPFNQVDSNTIRALKALGYHSFSGSLGGNFSNLNESDFEAMPADITWEVQWHGGEVTHLDLKTFEKYFDNQKFLQDKSIVICLHHDTFMNASGGLNKTLTDSFEKSIDYIKARNVKFVTIEEAYQLHRHIQK